MFSSCKILLVDDNENNLFTLESIISSRFDSKIDKVTSGEAALAFVLENSVDIILLDIQMPGMSGFEVADFLKGSERTRSIPILFLTAVYKEDEFQQKGFDLGAVDYMTKPIDDNLLLNRLSLYLSLIEKENALKKEVERSRQKDLIIAQNSKFTAIGEVINNIAHHWRQPLNALSLTIQDLLDAYSYGEINEKYINQTVNNSLRHINGMSSTINDFINFFTNETEAVDINLTFLVSSVVGVVQNVYDECGIDISIECILQSGEKRVFTLDELLKDKEMRYLDEVTIKVSQGNFKRALFGILDNSKDALISKEGEKHLKVIIESRKDEVALHIWDNGGGIDPKVIDKIFEPYFTTKEFGGGNSGVGLYMAKMIVEASLHGKLSVKNDHGGAKFTIVIKRELGV